MEFNHNQIQLVMQSLASWALKAKEISKILGVEGRLARQMAEYNRGGDFLPDQQLEERLEHIYRHY